MATAHRRLLAPLARSACLAGGRAAAAAPTLLRRECGGGDRSGWLPVLGWRAARPLAGRRHAQVQLVVAEWFLLLACLALVLLGGNPWRCLAAEGLCGARCAVGTGHREHSHRCTRRRPS